MAKASRLRHLPVPRRVEDALDSALDRALSVQRPVVLAHLDRTRRRHPQLSPAQVVERLEKQYLAAVIGIGGASGAAAAVPGVGTTASLASGAAEVTAFVSATAMYVLALAELHGIAVSDPEVRRALVLSVLVGEGSAAAIAGAGVQEKHWAQVLAGSTGDAGARKEKLTGINGRLASMLVRHWGTRQGVLLVGRALPLGIGAAVGAGGNAALARRSITSARRAFGPAPGRFPPRTVDVTKRKRPGRP